MLNGNPICPTLPVVDLKRAMEFYEKKIGLNPPIAKSEGFAQYEIARGAQLHLYVREKTKAEHTAFTFLVDNIEQEVEALKQNGIEFQEIDAPGIKTVNGIADMGGVKSAWFTDPEGNIVAISQFS